MKRFFGCLSLGALFWLVGYGVWLSLFASFVIYLVSGGGRFLVLVVKTLPRDVKAGLVLLSLLRKANKYQREHTTMVDLFDETAAKYPNKSAILFEKQKWTFSRLQTFTYRVANYFSMKGLKEGDNVAIYLHNCPEYIGLWLGLSRIGVSSALINYNLKSDVLHHTITVSNAKAVICSQELLPHLAEISDILRRDLGKGLGYYCLDGSNDSLRAAHLHTELEHSSSTPFRQRTTKSFNELLLYIYTSGTTGPPKAAKIMHHRFHHMSDGLGSLLDLVPSDVVYCSLPLYHSNGGILGAGQMILRGCTLVIRKKFSASQFWNDCITYGCTVIQYIGEICRYLLSQPKKPTDNQHFVRLAMGNGLKRDFWKQFQERFNIPQIGELYGATEGNASMVNITNRVGSCGFTSIIFERAHPLTLVKFDLTTGEVIRDKNGYCHPCLPGEPGLMVAQIRKSPVHRIDGYDSDIATRKKILTNVFKKGDRYFNSGDVLVKDDEGYFYFCDRTGDTFRWKGENVSTFEVESVMSRRLRNRDVIVYGVEVVGCEGRAGMAAVVDADGSLRYQDILEQLKGYLPTYAVPLFVRIIKEASMTGTGKYKKTDLKKEAFDVRVITDQVFFLHPDHRNYIPFTEGMLQELEEHRIRL